MADIRIDQLPSAGSLTTGDIIAVVQGGVTKQSTAGAVGDALNAVSSSSTIADNRLVRGDGGSRGVQQSGITVDDSNNLTGVGSVTVGNTGLTVGSSTPFSDAAGTLTLQNVDALDATTEATIEAAIDTLANLTSIQGQAVTFGAYASTVLNNADEAAFKATVNLEIGTDVQAYDADLAAIAALTPSNDDVIQRKAGVWTNRTMAQLISDLGALGTTFQPLDADLTAIAALSTTAYGRSLLELADETALEALLDTLPNLTSIQGQAVTFGAYASTVLNNADEAAFKAAVNLEPGVDVQAYDATLGALAAYNTNGLLAQTAADTFAGRTLTGTANQITVTNGDGVAGNPTLSLPADVLVPTVVTVPNTGLHLLDTNASHDLIIKPGSDLAADRTLTLTTGDADRTLTISANATVSQDYSTAGSPTFAAVTVGNAGLTVGASVPFSDAAGTLTLQNVDALDATSESTIEAAIDTLANLTSIQGRTVTLADAGANAIFGWDDTAGAYENLTAAEATATLNNFVGDSGSGGTKGLVPAPAAGDAAATKFLKADGTWTTPAGGGDVTAAAVIADNRIVRGDGGAKGVQESLLTIDDSGNLSGAESLAMNDTDDSHQLKLIPGSNLTAARTLTLTTGDADRTLTVSGNATVSQDYSSTGSPTFASPQVTTVELGHASDTTMARVSAGIASIEGRQVLTAGAAASNMFYAGHFTPARASIDFNSANTDTALNITIPPGFTRYRINGVIISGASASISTATYGLFTSTGGGGTAIVAAGTAITVTTASESTANNMMVTSPGASNTTSYTNATLYFRVGTAQGSAATATVSLLLQAVS